MTFIGSSERLKRSPSEQKEAAGRPVGEITRQIPSRRQQPHAEFSEAEGAEIVVPGPPSFFLLLRVREEDEPEYTLREALCKALTGQLCVTLIENYRPYMRKSAKEQQIQSAKDDP